MATTSFLSEEERQFYVREGESVCVVERCDNDWWLVRKQTTEEEGYVKSEVLATPQEYMLLLQERLDEQGEGVALRSPIFIESMEEVTRVREGESVTLRCKLAAYPPPQITWYKHTTKIESSSRVQITTTEDNVCTLVIKEASLEDTSTYTIVARNHLGFCSHTVELFVEGKLPQNLYTHTCILIFITSYKQILKTF